MRKRTSPSRRTRPLARSAAIERRIFVLRNQSVLLDSDLADLYGVSTKAVNQAVARNGSRFPRDFAFQITIDEAANLRSQIVTSSGHGGRRYSPRVFTEEGVAMLSSVLRSSRAVAVNVAIMRAFVRLRAHAAAHLDLARRMDDLERKYDGKFGVVFDAIRKLLAASPREEGSRHQIGFLLHRPGHEP